MRKPGADDALSRGRRRRPPWRPWCRSVRCSPPGSTAAIIIGRTRAWVIGHRSAMAARSLGKPGWELTPTRLRSRPRRGIHPASGSTQKRRSFAAQAIGYSDGEPPGPQRGGIIALAVIEGVGGCRRRRPIPLRLDTGVAAIRSSGPRPVHPCGRTRSCADVVASDKRRVTRSDVVSLPFQAGRAAARLRPVLSHGRACPAAGSYSRSGKVSTVSAVSTTNTASSFEGSVSLALALTL